MKNRKTDYDIFHKKQLDDKNSYLNTSESLSEIKKYLLENVAKDSRILELGSGGGFLSEWLYKNGYNNLVTSDYSVESLKKIKDKFPFLDVTRIDAMNFNVADKFDVVISLDLIEHLINPEKHLVLVYDILNKNGIYIIKTPNKILEDFYYKKILLRKDFRKKHSWWSSHISLMKFSDLKHIAKKTNFGFDFIRQSELTNAQKNKIRIIFPAFFHCVAVFVINNLLKIAPTSCSINFICVFKKK